MTDYPSIKPEDVREGDVVQLRHGAHRGFAVTEGTVWRTQYGNLLVGNSLISDARDLRLVSRPTPPEPPVRVGDWVRDDHGCTWQIANEYGPTNCHGRTRIEPPVGWPVGVPDPDAPGGVRWYTRTFMGDKYHRHHAAEKKAVFDIGWTDLVAAGGVPALAVTR